MSDSSNRAHIFMKNDSKYIEFNLQALKVIHYLLPFYFGNILCINNINQFYRSGAGSHYGTFTGPVKTFSPVTKPKKAYASPGRNFITNPSRKGTGYGYVNVLIGKPQNYASEPYDRAKEIRRVCFYLFGSTFKVFFYTIRLSFCHTNNRFDRHFHDAADTCECPVLVVDIVWVIFQNSGRPNTSEEKSRCGKF